MNLAGRQAIGVERGGGEEEPNDPLQTFGPRSLTFRMDCDTQESPIIKHPPNQWGWLFGWEFSRETRETSLFEQLR